MSLATITSFYLCNPSALPSPPLFSVITLLPTAWKNGGCPVCTSLHVHATLQLFNALSSLPDKDVFSLFQNLLCVPVSWPCFIQLVTDLSEQWFMFHSQFVPFAHLWSVCSGHCAVPFRGSFRTEAAILPDARNAAGRWFSAEFSGIVSKEKRRLIKGCLFTTGCCGGYTHPTLSP